MSHQLLSRWAAILCATVGLLAVVFLLLPGRAPGAAPGRAGRDDPPRPMGEYSLELKRKMPDDAASADAPLLLGIGIHVEPHGAVVSSIVRGEDEPPRPRLRRPASGRPDRPPANYNDEPYFRRTARDLELLASVVERHGGRLTVQVQTPFTRVAAEKGERVLDQLEKRGHEIGLHFHENAHLGQGSDLPVKTWTAVMKEEIGFIKQGGAARVRYWSGGNLYPGLLDAASAAGLVVMSDYKNPRTQHTDPRLMAVGPWRPSGGPTEDDLAAFAKHDPKGKIIYLPDGIYPSADFRALKRYRGPDRDARYFDHMTEGLEKSLRACRKDRVNVYHVTIHPGEFRGRPDEPYGIVETWLARVVDPLVAAGNVKWATFSQMADAFRQWEKDHPGVDPRADAKAAPTVTKKGDVARGYITFVINTHDWRHVDESAATLRRAVGIFEKHGVHGDFYLTGVIAERYAAKRPDIISLLKETGQTISYHVRPPHAVHTKFDARLADLDDKALAATLRDYETYGLDLVTGDLDRSRPGGYTYVADLFGCKPVALGVIAGDRRIRLAALRVYRDLGARAVVAYHESGTKPDRPFEYQAGLLMRPSDFSVTRWPLPGEREGRFWWNEIGGPHGDRYVPLEYLKRRLGEWQGPRPPFITALIHENNFCRSGPASWSNIYPRGGPRPYPAGTRFDLNAPDPSRPRSREARGRIWKAYEDVVAWAAKNLRVVTSAEIVAMAKTTVAVK